MWGVLTLSLRKNKTIYIIKHDTDHDAVKKVKVFYEEKKCLTGQHAGDGMTPSHILSQLRTTWHIESLYDELYNNWIGLLAGKRSMHPHPKVSAHLCVQNCDELELLYHNRISCSLAFVIKLCPLKKTKNGTFRGYCHVHGK